MEINIRELNEIRNRMGLPFIAGEGDYLDVKQIVNLFLNENNFQILDSSSFFHLLIFEVESKAYNSVGMVSVSPRRTRCFKEVS